MFKVALEIILPVRMENKQWRSTFKRSWCMRGIHRSKYRHMHISVWWSSWKCSLGERRICFLGGLQIAATQVGPTTHVFLLLPKWDNLITHYLGKSIRFEFGSLYANDLWIEREVIEPPPHSTLGQKWGLLYENSCLRKDKMRNTSVATLW